MWWRSSTTLSTPSRRCCPGSSSWPARPSRCTSSTSASRGHRCPRRRGQLRRGHSPPASRPSVRAWNDPGLLRQQPELDDQPGPGDGCARRASTGLPVRPPSTGMPRSRPLMEKLPTSATNPYGWTKVMIEQVLRDVAASDESWRIALLRYFNPIGAHPRVTSARTHRASPTTLSPTSPRVAVGRREFLNVGATTTPRPTAPASAITSTSWTWPLVTWPPRRSSTRSGER